MRITIKPGAYDGQRLRLKGKGPAGINGGPAGDLYIILKVQPDIRFQRDGDQLIREETIDLYTAVLGGAIAVPTMTGTVKVTVPPGSNTGKVLRLRAKGMPRYGKDSYGDLLVKLKVSLPENLTAEEEKLFRTLRDLRA
jgi:curved DNA-binding protein